MARPTTTVTTVPAEYIAARAAGDAALSEAGSTRALRKRRCENKKRKPGGYACEWLVPCSP
jgi:hypothetical protein